MSSVTLTLHPRFSLLEPRETLPRTGESFLLVSPPSGRVEALLRSALSSRIVAIDFETKGNDYSLSSDETKVVGIGLAWDSGSLYLDTNDAYEGTSCWELVGELLTTHKGLIAHNVYFDGGWIRRDFGQHASWYACTYGLYMQLAGEGWQGQRWGLKEAMSEVLLWKDTNEHELDQWLVDNGYKKNNNKPIKAEMWRAPASILGQYCVLDAEACYLLMTKHLEPLTQKFPEVLEYHQKDFIPHVKIHIDQKMYGINTDRNHWHRYTLELADKIGQLSHTFLNHPKTKDFILEYEHNLYQEFLAKEPERYLKQKLSPEPAKYKKDGKISKAWEKWEARSKVPPTQSKNWEKWNEKRQVIEAKQDPEYLFNIQSTQQLQWLMYEKLQFPVVETTESGHPAVGEDALKSMGELGKILIERITATKEMSYLVDYIERTEIRNTLHPSFKMPGTVTGRLAGKEPNLQQLPKTVGTLSGFVCRPGMTFVDCDVNALEMVVTAELSQDKNLLALYGPGAKKNDIYLFYGSMMPILGPKIKATGYDPYNPTPEAIDAAKKACKAERSIAKLLILSDNYGSGIGKKQKILRLNGVDMSYQDVADMHQALLDAKDGVNRYVRHLEDQWRYNKGWVYNGYGRPICVHESKKKDLLNRVGQSTGHDILQLYARIAGKLLTEAGIEWHPIVMDWHDEIIVEVPVGCGVRAAALLEKDGFAELNRVLGGTCPLKGSAAIATNFCGFKIES